MTNFTPMRLFKSILDGTFRVKPHGHSVDTGDTVADLEELPGTITTINNPAVNRLATIGAVLTELDAQANLTFDGTTLTLTGAQTISTTLLVSGVTTHGGNVVSDTDSTDDLGTTTVAWANLWVDTLNLVGSTSGDVSMVAPAVVTPYTVTWPSAVGAAGTALVDTLGDGILAWTVVAGMGAVTALNNQAENRLVTIGATTTELDGEANMTFDGTNFIMLDTTTFVLGHTTTLNIGFATTTFQVLGTALADGNLTVGLWNTGTGTPPTINLMKSANAAIGSNTIVRDNETIGIISFFGDDGVDFNTVIADIQVQVNDGTPAAGAIGGRMLLRTANVSGVLATAILIEADAKVTMIGNLQVDGFASITGSVTTSNGFFPNTDSTHPLGSASVRFSTLFVDTVGDTGQALIITAGGNNINMTAGTVAITGALSTTTNLTVTGISALNGQVITADPVLTNLDLNDINAQNDTLLAADILGGLTVHTSVTGAGTVTIDTGANIISGVPLNNNGDTAQMYYINDGDQTLTFAVASGLTISDVGNTLAPDSSCILIFRRTDGSNVVMHIIGST